MRALLVYNPNATTTTPEVIEEIKATLGRVLKLEVVATKRRDHAGYLAAGAVHEGHEVVLVLGGDGTVNEVLQGIAGTDVRLGIIPGGSTNVWARNLGLPNDPVAATVALLGALERRSERTVSLGRANGRYFGANAGFGFDAEVVRFVERRHRLKRTVRQISFLYCGVLAFAYGYDRKAEIRVAVDGADAGVLRTAIVCNANPYTYLGRLPVQLCPGAAFDRPLAAFGLTKLTLPAIGRVARAALTGGDVTRLGFTWNREDAQRLELTSAEPLPLQVDGDFVGEHTDVLIEHVERGITVVA